MSNLHPAILLFLTALLVTGASHRWLRQIILVAGTGLACIEVLRLTPATSWSLTSPIYTLHPLHVDSLSQLFGLIFGLITCIGVIYALHVSRRGEHVATLVYAGASLGVVYAGDWVTLFVFWELMALASLFVVWYGTSETSQAAGLRYLLVHIAGGSMLFCGILLHLKGGGSFTLTLLSPATAESPVAFWLILIGVALNAAVPPLHAWLTDAYPEASLTGSVFLSAFTTKTAVYVLIRLFAGTELLVWAGTLMALYGVVYAILEHDLRRLLAYHIVSQVGYMVAGVGMGTALALNGSGAHAFCHILYKALLFMGAGAVMYATGKRNLNDVGGLGRHMPLVAGLYMIAAFSISGVPLFNGFISKSMIITAAAEAHRPLVEILLTLASVGTFLSVGLKLPYFTFAGADRGLHSRPVPLNMLLAMSAAALLCLGLGVFPEYLYILLPFVADYHPYTVDHVTSSLQLLLGTGIGFWYLYNRFGHEATISLDTDWFYRRPVAQFTSALVVTASQVGADLGRWCLSVIQTTLPYAQNPFLVQRQLGCTRRRLQHYGDGEVNRELAAAYDENDYRQPIGVTVLWIVVFFALMVLYALGRQRAM